VAPEYRQTRAALMFRHLPQQSQMSGPISIDMHSASLARHLRRHQTLRAIYSTGVTP